MIQDWSIKGADESLLRMDSSAPLIHHDPNYLGSLFRIVPKERTLSPTSLMRSSKVQIAVHDCQLLGNLYVFFFQHLKDNVEHYTGTATFFISLRLPVHRLPKQNRPFMFSSLSSHGLRQLLLISQLLDHKRKTVTTTEHTKKNPTDSSLRGHRLFRLLSHPA